MGPWLGINVGCKEKRSARLEKQEAIHGRADECRLDLSISPRSDLSAAVCVCIYTIDRSPLDPSVNVNYQALFLFLFLFIIDCCISPIQTAVFEERNDSNLIDTSSTRMILVCSILFRIF